MPVAVSCLLRDATTAPVAKTGAPAPSTVAGAGAASATGEATIGTRATRAEVFRGNATVRRSAPHTIPSEWALVLLVGIGLAAWIGPRRALTVSIVLLLGIFAFETGVHSAHHLSLLVIAGGSLFALGYVLITMVSLYELWLRREARA